MFSSQHEILEAEESVNQEHHDSIASVSVPVPTVGHSRYPLTIIACPQVSMNQQFKKKGAKIYKMPSLSQCLANKIMPKQFQVLKDYFEIATSVSANIDYPRSDIKPRSRKSRRIIRDQQSPILNKPAPSRSKPRM